MSPNGICYMLCLAPKSERKSTQEGKNSRKGVSSPVSLKTTSGAIECGLAHMVFFFPYISQRFPKAFFRLHCGSSSENPLHYAFIFPKWY
ncbi:hypothetical protein CEXT_341371 [Caerostris extrusa]|uniref:Uncharacterized protein n=1 Tax=Caerostris extrusa TaxID=172846 RepID=A0AAV4SVA6_CAEEX|nr:hypothetical protein CEXT_341371 [Caerostris extrusa]